MTGLVWHIVRARMSSLLGTFLALALGVALLAAMTLTLVSTVGGSGRAPRWYTAPDVVVAGAGKVSITSGSGEDRETSSTRTIRTRALPAGLADRLQAALGGEAAVVVDVAGYAAADGAPGDTVHPWSAAALHPYSWVAGGAPRAAGDVVLSAPTGHRPGDRVTVATAHGTRVFTVSGVLRTDAPGAFYATDPVAMELADGRVTAVALAVRPATTGAGTSTSTGGAAGDPARPRDAAALAAAARAVIHDARADDGSVRVLTGNSRRAGEPDPDGERRTVAIALLGTTTGLGGFVSVFVVAGTFAYAVAARRREFGLLRAAGATPRQVFRLVLGEALAVGLLASLSGVLLGTLLAPAFAEVLVRTGFAPSDFTAHFVFWAVTPAFGTGLLVALGGAWAAAWRAGRIRPVEALREAAVDRRAMTVGRTVIGLLAFGGSVPLIAVLMVSPSASAVALIIVAAMLLIVGFALFAPLIIPPLAWLLTAPLAASPGAVGLLARHGARGAVRRTAATAAPILVTLGIAGATLTGFGTLQAATDSAARDQITADALVVPAVGAGLPDAAVQALRAVPGVRAAVPVGDASVYVRDDEDLEPWAARYATGADLAGMLDIPVTAGRLADLTGTDTVAVPAGSRWKLGERAELWLADSTPARPRVVAVLDRRLDLDETFLLPAALRTGHEPALATVVYLRLTPEAARSAADRAGVAAAVATATGGVGKTVGTDEYLSAANAEQARANRQASVVVLGMALVYTAIAIANTLVMATRDRTREFATVRLAGATRRQVLAVVGTEAVVVTGVGAALAAAVTGITAWGAQYGLADLAPSVPIVIPWGPLGAIAATCLAIALLASVIPASLLLRRDPADLAAVQE
ncbi:FtsX-like permease family protein [Pseudofrankia asymbiotica]|uniref:ABC3 transporter permease C-terminal domain-containing protein n=1 Tax=Pseudofrankia asymbiotica TaxID=1834516 RepID=A0A1V2I6C2_9ACTN|nr:FtsX family ABC transporter permease [Pseudofrankia asymbiotica]ONH26993.1 hypothetical protein BL253_23385 [Pseudofrankia asymbiotica]